MDRLKIIGMYLPQFHRVRENDEWWGEGFTEWTAVKSSEPLFEEHNQPRVPLDNNYYDLMEKKTMEWQVDIAHKYGIDGFCFYHYYFKNGRKILEKPAENLLKWNDIPINYCFCWANETWARTWSNISGANSWSEKFERETESADGVLLQQDYGLQKSWEEHFEYLLPFFQDTRYMKIENKPIFVFYKADDIPVLDEMLELWNTLAVKAGFDGVYSITVNSFSGSNVSAVLLQGPNAYRDVKVAGKRVNDEWIKNVRCADYEKIWQNAVECDVKSSKKVYYGGFVDYDDTPRRGTLGSFMKNVTPKIFEKYAYQLAVKNIAKKNELFFINAWNEWGEGNYLEPDEKNGYAYLQALRNIKEKYDAEEFDSKEEWNEIVNKYNVHGSDQNEQLLDEIKRYRKCYYLLDHWMLLREQNHKLEDYFKEKGYKRVIIYGFAAIGKHLFWELQQSSINVVCVLDRRSAMKHPNVDIISPDEIEKVPKADVIVVTVINDGAKIAQELYMKTGKNVVTLENIIFDGM